ncbi:MAG: hypothetical protein Q4G50_06195 [Corynebacterium sp.]|nr:hypothetical protein [Corynebacterium sp.]MDO5669576.1 hypothetical protein [Corynebacterium sp.]
MDELRSLPDVGVPEPHPMTLSAVFWLASTDRRRQRVIKVL